MTKWIMTDAEKLTTLYEVIKQNTYICSHCGKIIFPIVKTCDDGSMDVCKDVYEVRGGLGNRVVRDNICKECYEMSLLFKENT